VVVTTTDALAAGVPAMIITQSPKVGRILQSSFTADQVSHPALTLIWAHFYTVISAFAC
jgi:hypothetical protein